MSVHDTFAALFDGHRPAHDGLLGNARLEWGGGEAYGDEAVLQSFSEMPIDIAQGTIVQGDTAAAWIGAETALYVNLYDGRIGRIWRLGPGSPPPVEPSIAVAFDTDLEQARGTIAFRDTDHPELGGWAHDAIVAAGRELLVSDHVPPLHRIRGYVVRAFSADDDAVALYALHRLTAEQPRRAGFGYAMAKLAAGADPLLMVDPWSPPEWTPRL